MLIEFNKYQGAGNDFIVIDNRKSMVRANNHDLFAGLCNRRFGIGADGLILIADHPELDFEMLYYNSDGKPGTMCGNGGRCAFAFCLKNGIAGDKSRFKAIDGVHRVCLNNDGTISLEMSDVKAPEIVGGNHFLDTGSPHYIIAVPDVDSVNVGERGRNIRKSAQFSPGGTNVNFVEFRDNGIKIRTYERGVEAETLACGTGITAAAISSRWGKAEGRQSVDVEARGGKLNVQFSLDTMAARSVVLTGPAKFVYKGEFDTEMIIH
ncbi:MAG: diaminopimelate epimerase [Marinilabiliaceae bacterium]|jgi:diaminopimelate epimerase|nr:diaminopimelate epimerase [Marinilabiliaceae bacterium]